MILYSGLVCNVIHVIKCDSWLLYNHPLVLPFPCAIHTVCFTAVTRSVTVVLTFDTELVKHRIWNDRIMDFIAERP